MKKEKAKCLGIIGGMGPLATQTFYKMIIDMTKAEKDQDHIDMVILNHASMPDRTKAVKEGKLDELFAKLVMDARFLERSGASFIAIPCNTSHVLIKRLKESVGIPFINMIEESVSEIRELYGTGKRVGIMATDGTVKMGIYQEECLRKDLVPVIPSEKNQKRIMKIIYEGVKAGEAIDKKDFDEVKKEFDENGCECALLACTELSFIKETEGLPDYYVDAMGSLAKKAVELCGKELK